MSGYVMCLGGEGFLVCEAARRQADGYTLDELAVVEVPRGQKRAIKAQLDKTEQGWSPEMGKRFRGPRCLSGWCIGLTDCYAGAISGREGLHSGYWAYHWSPYRSRLLGKHTLTDIACGQQNERTLFCKRAFSRFRYKGALLNSFSLGNMDFLVSFH